MRRLIGLGLAGLAAFFAALAVILGGHIVGQAAETPPSERETVTLTASHASYLSPTRLTEVTGADIEVKDAIKGAADAGDPAIDVWGEDSSVYDLTNHQPLEPSSRTFAFDRGTAELVNCCGANVNGDAEIQQSGITGYTFPSGTGKRTYDVFDTTLNRPEPFRYTGTDSVDGIPAYTFAENISAASAGFSPLSRTAQEFYSIRRTDWVDPETGALLKISEDEDLYLANAATGATVKRLFAADLSTTPATVARLVSQDIPGRDAISVAKDARLVVLGIAGLLAATAVVLFGLGRQGMTRE